MRNIVKIMLLGGISAPVFAQNTGIGDAEITITKEKEIKLQKANRVFEKIPTEEKKSVKREMVYTFFERKPTGVEEVEFKPNVISPVEGAKRGGSSVNGYNNYLKVGGGNYGRFYAETYINSDQNKPLVYGIYGLHNAAKRGPIQGVNSGINLDQIRLDGKYHSSNFEVNGEIGYERRGYRFFGYDTLNYDLPKENIRQVLNIFKLGIGFENTNPNPVVDYSVKTRLRTLNDYYEAEEVDWGTTFTTNFPVIKNRVTAMLGGEIYLTQRTDSYFDNPTRKRNLFRVEPAFNIDYNQFNAKIGFKAVNEFDEIENVNQTKGFPTVTLTYKTPRLLYFFTGYDGDIVRNTLGSMLDENPWLKPQVELFNTVKNMEVFLGSRGNLYNGLNYNIKASYGKFSNLYFFNTYDGDPKLRTFEIYYEPEKTDFVNVTGELNYQFKDFWRTNLKTSYWYYETINFDQPYHRPSFEGRVGNTFIVSDKIVSNIDFYYIGSRFARDPFRVEDVKLPAITDLNAEFTYLFSQQFSAFVKLNNIIGKNYQRFYNYPQQGLNFLLGINVSL